MTVSWLLKLWRALLCPLGLHYKLLDTPDEGKRFCLLCGRWVLG